MANERTPHRVAVYFAPPPHCAWGRAGSRWLGRCAHEAAAVGPTAVPADVPGVAPQALRALLAEPRRYGFHATLKPPFELQAGLGLADVRAALQRLAQQTLPFTLPALRVSTLGSFLALRPDGEHPRMQALAARCVTELQPLAAPLSAEQLARRRRQALSAEQDALLQRWGYPWVLQQFRFHLSLTGDLSGLGEAQRAALHSAAQALFEPLPDCRVDSLALCVEAEPGADFVCVERVGLCA